MFEHSYLLRSTEVFSDKVVQLCKDERADDDGFNARR